VANSYTEDFPENVFVNRKNDHALNVMVVCVLYFYIKLMESIDINFFNIF